MNDYFFWTTDYATAKLSDGYNCDATSIRRPFDDCWMHICKNVFYVFFIQGTFLRFLTFLFCQRFLFLKSFIELKIPSEITFETTETNWVCMTMIVFLCALLDMHGNHHHHHHHQITDLGGMSITSVFSIAPFVPCTPFAKS